MSAEPLRPATSNHAFLTHAARTRPVWRAAGERAVERSEERLVRVTSYELPRELRVTSYELRATSYDLRVTSSCRKLAPLYCFAASCAVRAELFNISTFSVVSKSLKDSITLFTDSFSNKFSIQLIIVTNCELIISYLWPFIYVRNA